jgi:hypothetical protein
LGILKKRGETIMPKSVLTDEQVEREIEKLQASPLVKLARKEERIRFRRRQLLYCLRQYEKKGKELEKAGVTMEMLENLAKDCDDGE